MNNIILFALSTVFVNVWRLAAFTWKREQMSASWEQFLRFVPVSVFTALVVSSLYRQPEDLDVKLIALALSGIVIWRTKHFSLSIFVGLSALWLLSSAG
jgi:branched-subunit amino acid transport protein